MTATSSAARMPDPLAVVRAYARAGLPVLPIHAAPEGRCDCGDLKCHSPGKHPWTAHGLKDATTDLTTIEAWARRWPGCNWGLRLDGHVVVDCDPRSGGDITAELLVAAHGGAWPDTAIARTGGGGWHRLYRQREGAHYAGKLGPGLDLKHGEGGYIVVEPSIHASGNAYSWLDGTDPQDNPPTIAPEWIERTGKSSTEGARTGGAVHVLDDVVADLKSALGHFDADSYSDWILAAHCLRELGEQGLALWDEWSRASPKYGDDRRDPIAVWNSITRPLAGHRTVFTRAQERGWTNPRANQKRAANKAKAEEARANDSRPVIELTPGKRPEALATIDQVLAATGRVFQRGQRVVHVSHAPTKIRGMAVPARVPHISEASAGWVAGMVDQHARVERIGKEGEVKVTDCPTRLSALYLDRIDASTLPPIRGIASAPMLQPDGAINCAHGYDEHSGLWLDWDEGELNVPANPTRADALAALQRLNELVSTFPFADPKLDGAIAVAALMSAALRPTLARCPAFAFVSPTPATGKTKLARTIGALCDRTPPLPLTYGHSPEEFEKSLATAVIIGAPVSLVDNINADALNSNTLAVAITEGGATIRVFGSNRDAIRVESSTLWLLTGNNLWLADDLLRRILVCELDPGVENPELRRFDSDPEATAREHRRAYLRDVHTIVRAYRQSDLTTEAIPFSGFDDFNELVRLPLIWLGMRDVVDKVMALKRANPKRAGEGELLAELHRVFHGGWFKAAEALKRAEPGVMGDEELRAVLEETCPGKMSSRALGKVLIRLRGRIINGYALRSHESGERALEYRVERDAGDQRGIDF